MTDANRHNDLLTADDLRNYRAGTLSAADQHRVERLLLENPLYADALEGLETAEQEGVALSTASNALRERLQNRIGDQKVRRWPVWIPAAAASVVLVLSIGLYMRWHEKPESENVVGLPVPQPQISASKEDAPRVVPIEIPHSEQIAKKVAPPKSALPTQKSRMSTDSLTILTNDRIANALNPGLLYNIQPSAIPAPARQRIRVNPDVIQRQIISGRIVDETNLPLAGASILVKNSQRRSTTDTTGHFRMDRVQKSDTLQISYIGYLKQEVRVSDLPANVIQLSPDPQELAEVVVTGYSVQRKTELTGAVAGNNLPGMAPPSAPANFKTYVEENRRMPPEAKAKTVTGTVRVRFQVAADGSVSQFTIVQSLGYGCDEEAVRLIREGPRWKPAFRNGKPLIQFVEQDIAF
ncbi:energy transducer TonB [Larkinella sp. C7]|jgi:TonB family protein|uniref:energy transducer TonB n=1 Tax=Larkinella sp. C7 TaxID=2576607 RepID=UPI00111128AA|nr:energy transducer TonB [Larkinella sp. C7]